MRIIKPLLEVNPFYFRVAGLGWFVLITVAFLLPTSDFKEVDAMIVISDKLVHATFHFLNVLLLYLGFRRAPYLRVALLISLFSFVYGMVIEVLQLVMPYGRSADIDDVIANGIGVFSALILIRLLFVRKEKYA